MRGGFDIALGLSIRRVPAKRAGLRKLSPSFKTPPSSDFMKSAKMRPIRYQ